MPESMAAPSHPLNPRTGQKTARRRIAVGILSTMGQSEIWSHCASVGFFGFLSVFPVLAIFVLIYGLAFSRRRWRRSSRHFAICCGSACKKDPVSGVIGVQEGPLNSMV